MTIAPAALDAPFPLGADDRLHNSGPGRPPEMYRTPGVGARFRLDYVRLLRTWPGATPSDAAALEDVLRRRVAIPRALVARYARRIAAALGGDGLFTPRRDEATASLADLALLVDSLGLTRGMVLTARTIDRHHKVNTELRGAPPATHEQVAVALVTVAVCSPPLVLWSREPSLARLQTNELLVLTRLRHAGAGVEAERVWAELKRLETPGAT
jgi:hypothetical protein